VEQDEYEKEISATREKLQTAEFEEAWMGKG
jgi:hypothetical protein